MLFRLRCQRHSNGSPGRRDGPGTSTPFANFLTASPTVNIHGEAAFRATLTRQEAEGIWAERGTAGLQAVALRGQAAPGIANRSFESFQSERFNDSGQVAFTAILNSAPLIFNNDGLWVAQPDRSIDFIARSGGRVAGSSKNVVQIEPEYVALNSQGNISFRGRYTESFTHDAGVFSYTGPRTTALVVEAFDTVPNEPSPRLFSTVAFDGRSSTEPAGRFSKDTLALPLEGPPARWASTYSTGKRSKPSSAIFGRSPDRRAWNSTASIRSTWRLIPRGSLRLPHPSRVRPSLRRATLACFAETRMGLLHCYCAGAIRRLECPLEFSSPSFIRRKSTSTASLHF